MFGSNPSRPSTRSHRFDQVPAPNIQRSSFDLSRKRKTTFNTGYLYPLFLQEVLPGDTFSVRGTFFGRLQTLDFPMLDNLYFDTFWFYCPNRILWTNWARFLGALEPNNDSSIDFTIPTIGSESGDFVTALGDMADYFGLPIGVDLTDANISALPFRMYNRIFNEWFRAQELQDSPSLLVGDGPDNWDGGQYSLLRRGKRHDYITSCLIAPQRGDGVSLPIGTSAPVIGDGETLGLVNSGIVPYGAGRTFALVTDNGTVTPRFGQEGYNQSVGFAPGGVTPPSQTTYVGVSEIPGQSGLIADLSEAIAANINDMREAIALQQLLERDARFGTRYVERIFAQFRVVVPDFTAQRPEYLGGSIERVGVMQVPQTTASPAVPTMSDAKGALAAYAQVQSSSGFNRSFVEHGYIMCLGNLRAELGYQERIDKMWTRQTRYDFYDPLFAHLGEQAVLNKEVRYFAAGDPDGVFGYQERYAEYRMAMDEVTGKFRSAAAGTLHAWHLALTFAAEPNLNDVFIQDDPPIDRVLAIDTATQPNCLMDMAFQVRAARPMPVYSVPGLERL